MSREEAIGIVCHDAGGAEIISSYILQESLTARFCLEGPAVKVFERKLGTIKRETLLEVINNSGSLLCGTSWESDLEWDSIKEANNQGKKVISFLDHWVNYQERFVRNDITLLPDEIWVGDVHAKVIAKNCFPNLKIKLVENPYFSEITKILNKFKSSNLKNNGALYVCENISDHMYLQHGDVNYLGYTEHDSLKFFLENLEKIDKNIKTIIIRPHPSEMNPEVKYSWIKQHSSRFFYDIHFSKEDSLFQDILDCKIVVGAESMAMVIALQFERRVISSIPLVQSYFSLPFDEIEHLYKIVNSDYV
jgi:hypothetical protein